MNGLQTYRPICGSIDVPWLLEHDEAQRIDVRSEGEFARGHIPGAVNVPLFNDRERAIVGTLYKQHGREVAIQRGFELASSKADHLLEQISTVVGNAPFALHCWRGGMRSRGIAQLCDQHGLKPKLLQGGYKAFRRTVHESFEQSRNILLLAGKTGTGKTLLLQQLQDAGEQTIDLEGLAKHRGSVFGGIPDTPQPTTEQFENLLFFKLHRLDPLRPVWIEGENQSIGCVRLPHTLFMQMMSAPIVFVECDRDSRIRFLLDQYATLTDQHLIAAVQRLCKRLGGLRIQQAISAVREGDRYAFAKITLDYYDKMYGKALQQRESEDIHFFPLAEPADPASVGRLIQLGRSIQRSATTA